MILKDLVYYYFQISDPMLMGAIISIVQPINILWYLKYAGIMFADFFFVGIIFVGIVFYLSFNFKTIFFPNKVFERI